MNDLGLNTLRIGMSLHQALKLADDAFTLYDERSASIGTGTKDGALHLQCVKGCSYCCHLEVGVSALEVIAIKQFLERPENRSNLERVKTRVRHQRKAVGDLRDEGRKNARIMCPLLSDEGACGVYGARPIACRSYASFDRAACERDWQQPEAEQLVPYSETLRDMAKHLAPQIQGAQSKLGIVRGAYELIRALHVAFSTPDFERRCMAGEDVLAKAALR
ncbi:YkgJ family cysteine cluster protein [Aliidongia dinghuensis]|uniref:YkgJ family cysteine cluster protein n=1 Tax=Aliidongia dinghuensis TaxID=1867774 RepID=UPI00166435B1|nr:YkgJ family cysteine cluster protein [Aliidongia dinghuensis]